MRSPQNRSCTWALTPAYSRMLDHFPSSGFCTHPRRTGFKWIYSTFSWYSRTVRSVRSKKRSCHSSPASLRRTLSPIIELVFTDSRAVEMVRG